MPNRASPKLKLFARRLLAYEAELSHSPEAPDSTAFRVCEKLRHPLGKLLGATGFRALLSRALALAGAEVPWLRELQLKADGSVEWLVHKDKKLKTQLVDQGEAALVAHLIGLLVTFIGADLTLRIFHDIWPQMDGLTFETKEFYEKTN